MHSRCLNRKNRGHSTCFHREYTARNRCSRSSQSADTLLPHHRSAAHSRCFRRQVRNMWIHTLVGSSLVYNRCHNIRCCNIFADDCIGWRDRGARSSVHSIPVRSNSADIASAVDQTAHLQQHSCTTTKMPAVSTNIQISS